MDLFAIASVGAYPTPTPTATQRAAYAVSWGLRGAVATAVASTFVKRGLHRLGLGTTLK
jgi:hypothetical protein